VPLFAGLVGNKFKVPSLKFKVGVKVGQGWSSLFALGDEAITDVR